ncbi:carbohydrate ABC transporter permease [Paenibacillus sp. Soil724D2]|uniref:carbohydrate ABC transporter permease n=1 Tax=Paenibacillus sp. (strain Soil724D2) TaxID=1736392 RepID=UPI0007127392|nr:carbohydrate ABC transporter permease [Paenibacillus sp. Soil724D2]KRE33033.1 sugar ABC transporter permease [Paenibacillus sp. Soil724D2]
MRTSLGDKCFNAVNMLLLSVIGLAALYPFVYVLSASLSSGDAVVSGKVLLLPVNINLEAYVKVLMQKSIWVAYANTLYYTVVGTLVSLLLTICGAYPLSKKRLKGKGVINFLIALTMWFHAGMIPFYLNLRDMGMLNERFTIIIAFAVTTFYVFLLRTFFQSVPVELEEAAKIDGAGDYRILWTVYLPLSRASLMTVGLFYAVTRWNGYFWAMIVLKDKDKIPLQVLLKKLIVENNLSEQLVDFGSATLVSQETVIYATIIVSIIPMMVVYPLIQKYFGKGALVGSVKG